MEEETDRPVGERRRRREAEQAAAQAAGAPTADRPLTRRELRRREAEAAARRALEEAVERAVADPSATGVRSRPAATGATAGAAVSRSAGTSAPTPGSGPSAGTAETSAPTTGRASSDTPRLPSRRSLRERAASASAAPEESPQERTATARRPVVRTPGTAQGVRSLDSTGRLTGVQPVVRPDAPRQSGRPAAPQPEAAAPQEPSAPWDTHETFSVELGPTEVDGTVPGRSAALPQPPVRRRAAADASAPAPDVPVAPRPGGAGNGAGDPTGPGRAGPVPADPTALVPRLDAPSTASTGGTTADGAAFPLRPQWIAISSISGATPDSARSELPSRRSRMEPAAVEPDPGPDRPNPAVTAVKVAVLVLVAVVIGALIWLLADQALDDGAQGLASPPAAITTDHEEPRAR